MTSAATGRIIVQRAIQQSLAESSRWWINCNPFLSSKESLSYVCKLMIDLFVCIMFQWNYIRLIIFLFPNRLDGLVCRIQIQGGVGSKSWLKAISLCTGVAQDIVGGVLYLQINWLMCTALQWKVYCCIFLQLFFRFVYGSPNRLLCWIQSQEVRFKLKIQLVHRLRKLDLSLRYRRCRECLLYPVELGAEMRVRWWCTAQTAGRRRC